MEAQWLYIEPERSFVKPVRRHRMKRLLISKDVTVSLNLLQIIRINSLFE
jgi:hypothetical protein